MHRKAMGSLFAAHIYGIMGRLKFGRARSPKSQMHDRPCTDRIMEFWKLLVIHTMIYTA
jgi:hypothetical protein